jgi:hypothetical protein
MSGARTPEIPEDFGNPWMSNLQEISLPDPVPWTPQTLGWYGLATVAAIALGWIAYRLYKRWRADAYRRAALAELGELERRDTLQGLPALLKRVALAAYPRTEVARLSGEAWLGFLDGTIGSDGFTRGPGRLLPDLAYAPAAASRITDPDARALVSLARQWIRGHRGWRGADSARA